jgi:nitroreductase
MDDKPILNDTSSGMLGLLQTRRSGSAKTMTAPGPTAAELRQILGAGMRAPDHGKLAPWRFILFEGDARHQMGQLLVECLLQNEPQAGEERQALERKRFARAPVVVAVVSRVREGIPIPVWEQELSAGAVCQNILVAAHAMGFVANWITEWYAYDTRVKERLKLKSGERIAGYIYIGTSAVPLEERVRPDPEALVTRFEG